MKLIYTRLKRELARMGKNHWLESILLLQCRFDDYPMDDDTDQPIYEFVRILQSLGLNSDNIDDRLLYRIKNLACFTYRSFAVDENLQHIYWNPLECSYNDFKHAHADRIINIPTDDPYPAPDIIQNWIVRQMNSQSSNSLQY